MVRALRVAFADFSTTPWQGFEKSERGPNNFSLFQPLAAVVVVAVQVLLSAVAAKRNALRKTKRQWTICLPVDIPTGWEPRAKQQPTGLIAYGAARRRPVRTPSIAQTKKKNQYTMCTGFSWCSKAIQIRTIFL